jgi:signal transduction histidine kinase
LTATVDTAIFTDMPWYRSVLPAVLVVAVLATGFGLFASRVQGSSDATVVALSDRIATDTLVIESVLDPRSGLRPGDIVEAVDGRPADQVGSLPAAAGDVVTYTVQRAGTRLDIPVRLAAWPAAEWARRNWSALLLAVGLMGTGAVVFRRRTTDPAAATLLAIGALAGVGAPAFVLGGQVIDLVLGRDVLWYSLGEACLALCWAAWLLFVLLFPEPIAGWPVRRLVAGCALILIVTDGLFLGVALPTASSAMVAQWRFIEWTFTSGSLFPAAITTMITWRSIRARGTLSVRYIRWIMVAFAAGALGYYLIWQLPVTLGGAPLLDWSLVPLTFFPCVGTLIAAVLRFGLFDIKAVARRAVVYATLTLAVVAGYAGIVAAAGSLVTTGPILAPPLVATVIIAVLFQPLKDRVQRSVSRLLYGTRDEPYTALARLGEQLENTAAGPAVLDSVAHTVATTLKLPYVAAELCSSDGTVLRRTETGQRPDTVECLVLPAVSGGQLVGRLLVAPRQTEAVFGPSELRLLTDLVRQGAPALQALQLIVELAESRQRLVRAGAEERRRIQRDLHDSIGPALAGLRMQVGATRALLVKHAPDQALAKLELIEGQVVECTRVIRDLLVVLRSPLLDSLGLVGAIRHQAQHLSARDHVLITVAAPDNLPKLPAAVEDAALAIASEAMTNVLRHADARYCTVTLAAADELTLIVHDDGLGLDLRASASRGGTGLGLRNMRRRAAEIGGRCTIEPSATGGTEVRAHFPLAATS